MPRRSILSATERESLLALPDAKDKLLMNTGNGSGERSGLSH
jgi:hypothetical protein